MGAAYVVVVSEGRTLEQVSKRTYRVRGPRNHQDVRNGAQDVRASLAVASRPDVRTRLAMLSRFATGEQRRAERKP